MKARDLIRKIEKAGGKFVGQRGSHRKYKVGKCTTSVPMHSGDLGKGLVRAIERQLEPCLGAKWLNK